MLQHGTQVTTLLWRCLPSFLKQVDTHVNMNACRKPRSQKYLKVQVYMPHIMTILI